MSRPPFFIDMSLTTKQIAKPPPPKQPLEDVLKRQSKMVSIYKNKVFDRQIKQLRENQLIKQQQLALNMTPILQTATYQQKSATSSELVFNGVTGQKMVVGSSPEKR